MAVSDERGTPVVFAARCAEHRSTERRNRTALHVFDILDNRSWPTRLWQVARCSPASVSLVDPGSKIRNPDLHVETVILSLNIGKGLRQQDGSLVRGSGCFGA